jgi:hypothetical protein
MAAVSQCGTDLHAHQLVPVAPLLRSAAHLTQAAGAGQFRFDGWDAGLSCDGSRYLWRFSKLATRQHLCAHTCTQTTAQAGQLLKASVTDLVEWEAGLLAIGSRPWFIMAHARYRCCVSKSTGLGFEPPDGYRYRRADANTSWIGTACCQHSAWCRQILPYAMWVC